MVDDTNDETVIVLQNPVTMKTFQNHQMLIVKRKIYIKLFVLLYDITFYISVSSKTKLSVVNFNTALLS